MIERRLFMIFRVVEGGLDLTITPTQPAEAPPSIAIIRTVGDVEAETTLHFPGVTIAPTPQ